MILTIFLSRARRTAVRSAVLLILIACFNSLEVRTHGGTDIDKTSNPPGCKIIYAGFVGAMETSDHKASGIVQIRDTLHGPMYADVCAKSFLPYNLSAGFAWILTHFPSHSEPLSAEELQHGPRIILVGHSTGGWAMLRIARELRDKNIPVELTIQVDSVGIDDVTIPSNVKEGAIFYAHDYLMFFTTKRLKLEDPSKTRIVANVLVNGAGHLSITRDPRIRALIFKTIERLRTGTSAAESLPTPVEEWNARYSSLGIKGLSVVNGLNPDSASHRRRISRDHSASKQAQVPGNLLSRVLRFQIRQRDAGYERMTSCTGSTPLIGT